MKILHILYQSYPNISGSSTRSGDLINSQKKIGLKPVVVTSPFQNGIKNGNFDVIGGVKYYRTYSNNEEELVSESRKPIWIKIKKLLRIIPFTFKVYKIAKKEKPDVIHAHAMFFCALSGKIVSTLIGASFIYEVRSLWEERGDKKKRHRNFLSKIENFSLRLSKKFIVINKNLKEEFIARGFPTDDIFVVPNAINLNRIKTDDEISFANKKPEEITFGYIGSISPLEGLKQIVEVFNNLRAVGIFNKFYFFGSGVAVPELRNLVSQYGLEDQIIFKGSFASENSSIAYKWIDVIVNPRIKSKITDSVTPLKPLEALSYYKLYIGSDVGGISELIVDGESGILFNSQDTSDLEKKILWVLQEVNKSNCIQMIVFGNEYVKTEKSWDKNALIYNEIYSNITKKNKN